MPASSWHPPARSTAIRSCTATVFRPVSFRSVDDEIDGFVRLLDSDQTGPINIGDPDEFTMLEPADLVIRLTGSSSGITHLPLPSDDPRVRRPDIALARTLLDWEPAVPLADGLTRAIGRFRASVD